MYGTRLKTLRNEKKQSQSDLAIAIGVKQENISRYEMETRVPPTEVLIKFADYFDVSLDFIMGRDFDNNSSTKYPVKNELDYYCSKLSEEDQIKVLEIAKSFYHLSKEK